MSKIFNYEPIFNHSGNAGDLFFSLHFVVDLIEYLKTNIGMWTFNIQTNQPAQYYGGNHPYGNVMMVKDTAEMIKPLLLRMGFKDVTISDNAPQGCINLSNFRKMRLNLTSTDLRSLYYSMTSWHLRQDFTRNLFTNVEVNKHPELNDKILLIHTSRYNNVFIDLKMLERFKDKFMFIGTKNEHEAFCKQYFEVKYLPFNNFLELAEMMKSACGVIGNQSGLYSLAEMLKVPRILLSAEFNNFNGKAVIPGPCNVNALGGWVETVRIQEKLLPSVQNLINECESKFFKSNTNSKIDVVLNKDIFKNKQNGTYIECGANDGLRDSISFFFEKYLNWNGVLVEPLKEMMNRCKSNRSSSNIFVEKGLGDKDEKLEMTIPCDNLDNASFNLSNEHYNKLKEDGFGKEFKKQYIDVITYDTLMKMTKLEHVDLFILDVEGYENKVLTSMINSNILPDVVVCEYDWSNLEELINIINSKYNLIYKFEHDVIFVKK